MEMLSMNEYYDKFSTDELLKFRARGINDLSLEAHAAIEQILKERGVVAPPIPKNLIDLDTLQKGKKTFFQTISASFILSMLAVGLLRYIFSELNLSTGVTLSSYLLVLILIVYIIFIIWKKFILSNNTKLSNSIGYNGFNEHMYCACIGDTSRMSELLAYGVDIDARDDSGATALMYAIDKNQVEAVKFLLKNSADTDLRTKAGKSVFDLARMRGNPKIIDLLSDCAA